MGSGGQLLPGGVSVWPARPTGAGSSLTRRAGRDLAASLMRAWEAAGCFTRRRGRALDAHRARLTGPPGRARPSSYAWPELRREAERRVASGEAPAPGRRGAAGSRAAWVRRGRRRGARCSLAGGAREAARSATEGRQLHGGEPQRSPGAVADDPELDRPADAVRAHQALEVADVRHGGPSTSTIRSSARSPARSAGLPGTTSTTSMPASRPARRRPGAAAGEGRRRCPRRRGAPGPRASGRPRSPRVGVDRHGQAQAEAGDGRVHADDLARASRPGRRRSCRGSAPRRSG